MTDDRQLVKQAVGEQPARAYRMCPFCGRPCRGRACASHRDLILIENDLENGLSPESQEASRTPAREAQPASSTEGA